MSQTKVKDNQNYNVRVWWLYPMYFRDMKKKIYMYIPYIHIYINIYIPYIYIYPLYKGYNLGWNTSSWVYHPAFISVNPVPGHYNVLEELFWWIS